MPEGQGPLVAVVGPCTSGKTTLVAALSARGVRAVSVAQEHSNVPTLYRRARADLLVYLDVTFAEAQRRREVAWGPERLEAEGERLAAARAAADLVLLTDGLDPVEVADRVAALAQGTRARAANPRRERARAKASEVGNREN